MRNSAGARFTAVNRLLVVVGSIVGGLALFSTGMSPGWAAGANSSGASSVVQGYTSLIDGGGYAPTGPEQSAAWTPSQAQTYANKLAALFASEKFRGQPIDQPYVPAGLPKPTTTTASTSAPPSSGNIPGVLNTPEPNSSYGYQCGPAAGHNALGGYGVNYPIGSGSYPNATYLTYDMQTTQSSGTNRGPMPTALNNREKQDTYVWQNLGGTSDVSYYTTLDIEYKDAPIYNIETYGYDPLNGTYEYPFYQWNGWDIRHYVTAYGYSSSGSWISISDPAVKGSYTAAQRYTQWYSDVWVAINNLPLTNQILW